MQPKHIPFWKRSPMLRVLPCFIGGVLIQDAVSFSLMLLFILLLPVALLWIGAWRLPLGWSIRLEKVRGVLLMVLVAHVGMLVTVFHRVHTDAAWFGHHVQEAGAYRLRVAEMPETTTKYYRSVAEVTAMHIRGKWQPASGKTFAYFPIGKYALPEYGDVFYAATAPVPIAGAKNPGGFDFGKYAARKNVHFAFYLNDTIILSVPDAHPIKAWILQCRKNVLAVLEKYLPHDETLGIAEALLIGYRDNLDDHLMDAYASTGVVHVIAISGLHLGLIYAVLLALFNRIPFTAQRPSLKCVIVLFFLWWFSLITGGSASVLRSAVMFTCMLSGTTWFKQSDSWNALAASAFILLVYDPYFLWDAGFLLSYAAVAGLMAWQGPLYRLLYIKSKLLRSVWNMASVTIAAQLAAFPLCLFYFHQFPNYFLFSNMLVVPLSTIILFAELALLILQAVPVMAEWCGWFIHLLIRWMNEFILWCKDLPFSVNQGIYADEWSTILWYGAIIISLTFLLMKKRLAIHSLMAIFLLSAYFSTYQIKSLQQQKLVVYHTRKSLSVDFINGNHARHYTDSIPAIPPSWQRSAEAPARTMWMAEAERPVSVFGDDSPGFLLETDAVQLAVMRKSALLPAPTGDKQRWLLLYAASDFSLEEMAAVWKPNGVVLSTHNPAWKTREWKKECERLNLRCISIPEQGAWVLNVP